jgi:hypothetical protein
MKHKKVVKNLEDRRKSFDQLSKDAQDARKRPGSMSGRK